MMEINAIIVDDEPKAVEVLKDKLQRFCPNVKVNQTFTDSTLALKHLEKDAPQLVFLDIAMPIMGGFDILEKIANPQFEVIFVTAFNQYAIEAIKHCAIGYLVKPVKNELLIEAVHTAHESIRNKEALKKNQTLIENLQSNDFQDQKLVIPFQGGLEFVKITDIVLCEGKDGYTNIYLSNGRTFLSSYNIGFFDSLLQSSQFFKVHKSYIINCNNMEKYLNHGEVILNNKKSIPVARSKRTEFMNYIKDIYKMKK